MQVDDRLAVCSWSLQPTGCDDLIRKVRDCGLSRVQLHLDNIAEGNSGWENAPAKLREANISVVSGMVMCVGEDYTTIQSIEATGGVLPDGTWPQTRERMAACVPLAAELGLKLVTFHAGFIPQDVNSDTHRKVSDRINEVADLFAAHDIAVALETGQESADALLGFLNGLGRTDIGVNFDPANMLLYGSGDPIDALAKLSSRVKQVHLKDAKRSATAGEWGAEVPVGQGEVDWTAFFRLLDQAGYAGWLPIEREAGDDRVGDIRSGIQFVHQL